MAAASPTLAGSGGGEAQPMSGRIAERQDASAPKPLVEFRNIMSSSLVDSMSAIDEVTCAAVHSGTAVLGTRQGSVLQVDHAGARVGRVSTNNAHVHCVSIDSAGSFCACGLGDGRVAVLPLPGRGAGDAWIFEHGTQPVLSVALCPEYASPSPDFHCVCAGGEDGRLVLRRRSRYGAHTVIHEGEGFVTRICWRSPLIAWANDKGVKIYNVTTDQRVTFIARPPSSLGASVTCRCCLAWAAEDRLLVGWGTAVKVAVVLRAESGAEGSGAGGRGRGGLYAVVRQQFPCPETVCGLADAGEGNLGVLTADRLGSRATLSLCSYSGDVFHVVDVPLLRGAFPSHLHLSAAAPHLPMFVAAPRDLLALQLRDLLEHAVELVDAGRADEAIRVADGGGAGIQGLRHVVCLKCVAPDLRAGGFESACATVSRFRELEAPTWQELVMQFDRFGGLQYLAVNVIPVPPKGARLPQEVYDEVLQRLAAACPSALAAVLSWWPSEIFSSSALEEKLRKSLPDFGSARVSELDSEDRCRVEALALLSAARANLAEAARLLLELRSPEVFRLLRRGLAAGDPGLAGLAQDSVQQLFETDDREACALLVEHRALVPVDAAVEALQNGDNRWRHEYLKQLFAKDEVAGQKYHMQMVRLYAEYESSSLLRFLRASERYPLEDALGVCQQRGLLEEEAYLLGRAGRVGEALRILLEKVGDVDGAVAFASEYQDPKLWEELVNFVREHPHLLVPLLERLDALDTLHYGQVGSDSGRPQPPPTATPAHVLRRLPPNTPVPRIASSVKRVFDSFELSASLHVSCSRLSGKEMMAEKKAFMGAHTRGSVVVPESWRCRFCGRPIGSPPPRLEESLEGPDASQAPAAASSVGSVGAAGSDASEGGSAGGAAAQARGRPGLLPAGIMLRGRCAVHVLCHERDERARRPPKKASTTSVASAAGD